MSSGPADASLQPIRQTISRLQSPIPDLDTLLALLTAPLDALRLLPPQFLAHNTQPLPPNAFSISRHLPPLQRALILHVVPTWHADLRDAGALPLLDQYFCPDAFSSASTTAGEVALHAYPSIISTPLNEYTLRVLSKLSKAYPIDRLHTVIFNSPTATADAHGRASAAKTWEDCVRDVCAVPAKATNAAGPGSPLALPAELAQDVYFNHLSLRTESLVADLSAKNDRDEDALASLAYLLAKLVNLGLFPATPPIARSSPSFWTAVLPTVRRRLPSHPRYASYWPAVLGALSSPISLRAIISSLLAHLPRLSEAEAEALDASPPTRTKIRRSAVLLYRLLGLDIDAEGSEDVWTAAREVMLLPRGGAQWTEADARVFVCAAAESKTTDALESLLAATIDLWSTPEHVTHSLLSRHRYVTSLALLALTALPRSSSLVPSLAHSQPLIHAVGLYIGHLDKGVRRCGMLLAETLAQRAGKALDFGADVWSGDEWAARMRALTSARDVDAPLSNEADDSDEESGAEPVRNNAPASSAHPPTSRKITVAASGYDSDDSLTGYASPPSSRSPSPTPSELEELAREPTLAVGAPKVSRPVYLLQLAELVRPTSTLKEPEPREAAERIRVALDVGEELVRRKAAYGSELEENAVNLVHGFIALNDNYETPGFDEKRQAVLTALVACCPRKSAPTIIEQFFSNQYSTDQRFVMLAALALGARELAGLPVPASARLVPKDPDRLSFPSRKLPPALHQQLLTAADEVASADPVRRLVQDISRQAIDRTRDETAGHGDDKAAAPIVRERRLRVRQPAGAMIQEVPGTGTGSGPGPGMGMGGSLAQRHAALRPPAPRPRTTFADVGVEYFIYPLVTRFWTFLRDEQAREARTAHLGAQGRYHGAGTGLILNAAVLERLLGALAVLAHAARHAPAWLAVVAPDAVEVALAMGTRRVSRWEAEDIAPAGEDGEEGAGKGKGEGKEAAVVTAALELALTVLDGCVDLDGGRSLGLEHTALVLGVGEWAGKVLETTDRGQRMRGVGGALEMRLARAAAGVVLKTDEITRRWGRSMVDVV
ncbi:hypothetical protein PUNSTDRAFT_126727 [Punctularia strigosozonata HHB-11173 SS5]|uniref:uncharacterized protein n=1 Tax=Punctularia strigosozonata (strain HHB-11173) TaxID=741275 RepID=UPI0004417381|nr:uncharacterized protein PUNSTDRAFT_126727 [Punctularia strigosozonata HHB-11173 SS5]EIN07826.1 hypothetical protein PUNSTDRAFT_126727 [Punctularia strigosozonata HHB-11173 SS5]